MPLKETKLVVSLLLLLIEDTALRDLLSKAKLYRHQQNEIYLHGNLTEHHRNHQQHQI